MAEEAGELLREQLTQVEMQDKIGDNPSLALMTALEYVQQQDKVEEQEEKIIVEAIQVGAMAIRFLLNRIDEEAGSEEANPDIQ